MDTDKAALLQFLGTFHAQAKETEKQIVEVKSGLKPMSDVIKEKFAEVLTVPPQTPSIPNHHQQLQLQPQPIESNSDQLELNLFNPPIIPPYNNDRVIEILSKINSNIERLCSILIKNEREEKSKGTEKI
jgi:hypothetical protein